jgi:hypothetical protein
MTLSPYAPPITIGRNDAQDAARHELSKRVYHLGDKPLLIRAYDWLMDRLGHLLDRAAGASPGGALGLVIIALVVVALVVVIARRVGAPGRRPATQPLFETGPVSAAEHRRRADEHAAAGRYDEAVRERLRAVVRELETRGVLEPRPGRTADEAAAEAGAAYPEIGPHLRTAVRVFDEIWYGGRTATAEDDTQLRDVDSRLRAPLAGARQ